MSGYPLKKLPLKYEEMRTLYMDSLAELNESTQIVEFVSVIARLACKKGIVPDPNGPNPDRHAYYHLDHQDAATFLDIMWDLIIEGVIRPGIGKDGGNADLPFFHVTEYGKEQIRHGRNSPHDPDGFIAHLQTITGLDPIIVTYVNEALRTFRIGCLLSSAVMLGCASEKSADAPDRGVHQGSCSHEGNGPQEKDRRQIHQNPVRRVQQDAARAPEFLAQ